MRLTERKNVRLLASGQTARVVGLKIEFGITLYKEEFFHMYNLVFMFMLLTLMLMLLFMLILI